ncbi:type I restriction modification DNA specificity domain protein [Staphylococcus aureus]|nr:type I restriction modification DNA specificity domain protein [Staphylococcus aureus]
MKQGVVSSKKLFRRLDVKYHFNENKEIDNYVVCQQFFRQFSCVDF